MIDIMALKQSYKGREIYKNRWIYGKDNLVDAMTKILPNLTLEKMISINKTTITLKKWVKW